MDMVGHQAPAVDAHVRVSSIDTEQLQICQVTSAVKENGLAVDAALHHMVRQPDSFQPRSARHNPSLGQELIHGAWASSLLVAIVEWVLCDVQQMHRWT